jgi:hypothetical protein
MIEPRKHFSDETIRRFLLGGLSASEQAGFEQSLFVDDDLEERVRLAELELSDDYATGRLSSADRNLFEAGFLLTADRRRQLNVSKALQQTLSFQSPARVDESTRARIVSFFHLRRHAWKYAFAALILMMLLGTVLLVKKERSRLAGLPFILHRAAPKPTATVVPQSMHHSPNSPAPTHPEEPPALPLHEGLTPSVVLNSNTPLEAAPLIRTSGEIVTLELRLDQPLADHYDVNVMTMAGESVFMTNAVERTEPNTIGFNVPASAIESGDFQVALVRADNEPKQLAGVYYFRVR